MDSLEKVIRDIALSPQCMRGMCEKCWLPIRDADQCLRTDCLYRDGFDKEQDRKELQEEWPDCLDEIQRSGVVEEDEMDMDAYVDQVRSEKL